MGHSWAENRRQVPLYQLLTSVKALTLPEQD